jgi:hypothetical protein
MRAITHREDPRLLDRIEGLSAQVWPEYNMHGDVMNHYWGRLYEVFPEHQFVLYDEPTDTVLAEGHTIPCYWDGTAEGLPAGIDGVIEDGFRAQAEGQQAQTLCALAVEIPPAHQARRLSATMLEGMRSIARAHGLGSLIAPIRPNWKERYPITPIEEYAGWTRPDGLPFDPWMRVHARLGARMLKPEPESLLITGTVEEWETWTGMAFPASGDYVFPQGLAPVSIDRDADLGRYWEPNVWMVHPVTPES